MNTALVSWINLTKLKGTIRYNVPTCWYIQCLLERMCDSHRGYRGIIALDFSVTSGVENEMLEWLGMMQEEIVAPYGNEIHLIAPPEIIPRETGSLFAGPPLVIKESSEELRACYPNIHPCRGFVRSLPLPWEKSDDGNGYLILHGSFQPLDRARVAAFLEEDLIYLTERDPKPASITLYDIGLDDCPPHSVLRDCLQMAVDKEIIIKTIAHPHSPLRDMMHYIGTQFFMSDFPDTNPIKRR